MSDFNSGGNVATLDPPVAQQVAGHTGEHTGETGETGDKPKRTPKPRIKYRADNAPKLTVIPEDYSSKFLPLSKDDFEDEATYYDFQAVQWQKKADSARQKAEDIRSFGSPEERKAAEALRKMQDKMQALLAKMREGGMTEEQIQKLQASIVA